MERDNIFVMDTCSIHMKGDNGTIQDQLLEGLGVPKIALPPYWHELNLIDLVFQTLLGQKGVEMIYVEKVT